MSVDSESLLLLVFGSDWLPVTLAVLVFVPALVGVTTIVTVAEAPLARLPRLQVTMLVPLQLPWLGVADTKATPVGNVSVIVTPVAVAGPLLLTVIV
jgi:hypothetical protein